MHTLLKKGKHFSVRISRAVVRCYFVKHDLWINQGFTNEGFCVENENVCGDKWLITLKLMLGCDYSVVYNSSQPVLSRGGGGGKGRGGEIFTEKQTDSAGFSIPITVMNGLAFKGDLETCKLIQSFLCYGLRILLQLCFYIIFNSR